MSEPRKRLILVHGRSTKPSQAEKTRLVRDTLVHGVARASPEAAERLSGGDVRFDLAYYGDISNRVLLESDPALGEFLTETDPEHDGARCERAGSYDESLAELLERPDDAFTRKAYREFLGRVKDRRWLDEVASVASAVSSIFNLSGNLVRRAAPDMSAYLRLRRDVGSPIRARLQGLLREALVAGDDVCLVAHSMGCMVAYDVLWKFSAMSEYIDVRDKPVRLWLTLGNPLGEPGVRNNLYDALEHDDGKYPRNAIDTWVNFTAVDDFVAHDDDVADDFRVMRERGYLRAIEDRPRIYTFWCGYSGSNPHKLYAYLDHPAVGAEIASWILRPAEPGRRSPSA